MLTQYKHVCVSALFFLSAALATDTRISFQLMRAKSQDLKKKLSSFRLPRAHENAGPTNASELITGSQVNFFLRLTHSLLTIDSEILPGGGGGTAGGKCLVLCD